MKKKRRGSSRFFFLFVFIALTIYFGFTGVKKVLSNVKWFTIKHVAVEGNINLDREYLADLAKEYYGKNLFIVKLDRAKLKYKNIIRIKNLSVRRKLPNTLLVKIEERIGKFYLKSKEGNLYPIDEERVVLDNDMFYESEVLPVVDTDIPTKNIFYGEAINNKFVEEVFKFSTEIQNYDEKFLSKVSEFSKYGDDICIYETNIGYKVIFNRDDLENQLTRFKFIEENRNFAKKTTVDLRFSNQLIVKTEEN